MKNKLYILLLILVIIATSCSKINISDNNDDNKLTNSINEDYEKYSKLYDYLRENLKIEGYNLKKISSLGSINTFIPKEVTFNNKELLSLDDDERKSTWIDLLYESEDNKSLITIDLAYMGNEKLYNTLDFFSDEVDGNKVSFYTIMRYENSIITVIKYDYSDVKVTESVVLNRQGIYTNEVKHIIDTLKEYKDIRNKGKTN